MFLRRISGAFAGGTFAALVVFFTLWVFGQAGLLARLDIGLRPPFSGSWLYPRLLWGGLWGLLLLLPVLKSRLLQRGALFGLVPAALYLFVLFPRAGRGYLGLEFGALTPVLVVLLGCLWGVVSSLWYQGSAR